MNKTKIKKPVGLDFGKGLQDEENKSAFLEMNFVDLSKILSNELNLEKLIAATRISAASQIRTNQTYKDTLLRPQTVAAALPESRLERAMWVRWGLHKSCEDNPYFLKDCPHIVSYQVPLYNQRPKKARDGWGKIDVVGVASEDLTPVVIELKVDSSKESLLRMVLEGVAYGIAVQVAWNPQFLQDWKYALTQLASKDDRLINPKSLERLPANLNTCRILCAAPSEYWKAHNTDGKSEEFKVILRYLRKKGFPVSFAKLNFTIEIVKP
jgi:hypothetical protein